MALLVHTEVPWQHYLFTEAARHLCKQPGTFQACYCLLLFMIGFTAGEHQHENPKPVSMLPLPLPLYSWHQRTHQVRHQWPLSGTAAKQNLCSSLSCHTLLHLGHAAKPISNIYYLAQQNFHDLHLASTSKQHL